MVTVLSLFSESEMKGLSDPNPQVNACAAQSAAPSDSESSLSASAVSPKDYTFNIDPCPKCRYYGMCSDGECAMKLFPLDMNHKPTRRGWVVFGLPD